ncbi:hypothetical protein BWI17_21300 [Betaproteobacteria bacterium GR16-43]|nr:hypothetical protein BWI17_21300 [Betaproteobacteria bacterium GR16-43]
MAPVRIETVVDIDRAPPDVFNYVTAPTLWHTWHPATSSVSAVPDRPIRLGETVREDIRVGLKRFATTWEVVECSAPQSWAISTDSGEGVALIRYDIQPRGEGCRFTRVMEFRSRYFPWKALDTWLMKWILTRNSRRALDQLKRVMER